MSFMTPAQLAANAATNGPSNAARIRQEQALARKVVRALLAAGYEVSVYDSEEITLRNSSKFQEICDAMATSDDDRLYAHKPGHKSYFGWVWLIYGNGEDLISDYTTNLESIVGKIV